MSRTINTPSTSRISPPRHVHNLQAVPVSQDEALLRLKMQARRTRKPNEETRIQRACLQLLTLRRITAWRVNTGIIMLGPRPIQMGAKGMSDILGLLPGGRFLAVEVKTLGQQPNEDQWRFLNQVRDAGGVALVVHSAAQLNVEIERLR